MKLIILIILTLIISSLQVEIDDDEYKQMNASQKREAVWTELSKDTTSYGWYSTISMIKMFFSDMLGTFSHSGDKMPDEYRKKYIHSVGLVGKLKFVSTGDHRFTGIFRGCKNMIGRFSTASNSDTSKTTAEGAKDNFAPGMALKCFRSKKDSANLIAMFSVEGQASWNFFKNDFTNHIPEEANTFLMRKVAQTFSKATPFVATLGTAKAASISESGRYEKKVVIPFSLIFKPNDELRKKFSDEYTQNYIDQLQTIEPGTKLYDVYANSHPDQKEKKIGEIILEEKMITSKFGDKSLFFQHDDWKNDLNIHPSWRKYRHTFEEAIALMNNAHKEKRVGDTNLKPKAKTN